MRLLLFLLLLPLTACASVEPTGWTGSRTYVGVVRVDVPATVGDVQAIRVRTLGLGAGTSGLNIGWEDGDFIIADPSRCQMVVVIRSDVEIANAANVLRQLEGQDICIVNSAQ